MLDGELHTRGISTDLRDYYLSQIYKDYGADKLRIALKAYMDFIIYYEEGHNNTTRKIERDIHQKYCNILSESNASRTIENEINAFLKEGEERYVFQYKLSDVGKKSIMTINCFDKPIIRFYSYNCPIARIKMSLLPNIGVLVHDEICVNPEWGENYPAGMYKKFREIYTTLERKKKNGKLNPHFTRK